MANIFTHTIQKDKSTNSTGNTPIVNETNVTFINKYKPYYIDDFCLDQKLISVIKLMLELNNLNILFVGNSCSGKTTLLYALIREYYGLDKNAVIPENNILFINNLKEQGIHYFRNEMKTFCQSHSSIYGKKKFLELRFHFFLK
jgi:DNA polymerase III delta prime subunit